MRRRQSKGNSKQPPPPHSVASALIKQQETTHTSSSSSASSSSRQMAGQPHQSSKRGAPPAARNARDSLFRRMTNAISMSVQQSDFSDLSMNDFHNHSSTSQEISAHSTAASSSGGHHSESASEEQRRRSAAALPTKEEQLEAQQQQQQQHNEDETEEDEFDERDIELTESLHEHFPTDEREEYVVNYFFEGEKYNPGEPFTGKIQQHLEQGLTLAEWEAQNKLIKFDMPKRYHIQRLIGNGNYAFVCSAMMTPFDDSRTGDHRPPHDPNTVEDEDSRAELVGAQPVAVKKNVKVFPRKRQPHPQPNLIDVQLLDDLNHELNEEADGGVGGVRRGSRALESIEEALTDKEFLIQKRIVRELKILKHLHHENIISLKDLILPQTYEDFEDVYIVTDLMDTDLRSIIQKDYNTCKKMINMSKNSTDLQNNAATLKALAASLLLSDTHIQYITYQILRGLKYIHSADILHRDLKPNNILLNTECQVKICDFGLARGIDFESGNPRMSTSYVQTRWYRAPELLLNTDQVTKAIDVWSVGCILAELLGRKPLFRGADYLDQIDKILDILGTPKEEDIVGSEDAIEYVKRLRRRPAVHFRTIYPNANPLAIDLLEKLLVFNPAKRFSAAEALAHPFFSEFHDENNEPTCAPFDDSFEEEFITKKSLKQMCFEEILNWNIMMKHNRERELDTENISDPDDDDEL